MAQNCNRFYSWSVTSQDAARPGVEAAVERLAAALETRVPCAPVRDLIGTDDLSAAYAVQQGLVQKRLASGANVVGRKIGATSEAVQQQLGVDQPDFGYLFDDMDVSDHEPISMRTLLQPRVEAEVAFRLGRDVNPSDEADITIELVREAVEVALPALEIVDSRIDQWDIEFTDTVADNASSGLYVVGSHGVPLDELEPRDVEMSAVHQRGGALVRQRCGLPRRPARGAAVAGRAVPPVRRPPPGRPGRAVRRPGPVRAVRRG